MTPTQARVVGRGLESRQTQNYCCNLLHYSVKKSSGRKAGMTLKPKCSNWAHKMDYFTPVSPTEPVSHP